MKTTTKLRSFLLIAGSSLLAISYSHAGIYYWDINGGGSIGSSTGTTASGTWSSGGTTWNTTSLGDGATPAYTTLAADDLFFSAGTNATGTSAIALTSTQNASSLTFEDGTVTISGASGVITLGGTGGNITVNSGRSAIIGNNTNTIIGGSVGLTKLGAGTLTLNGTLTNTFTGGINVNGGTLALDYANMAASTNLVTSQALTFGGGNLTLKGKSTGDTTQSLGNVTVNAGGGTLLIDPNNGTSTTLTLGTLTATAAGGSLTVGSALSAGSGTLAITTTTDKDATGIYGGRLVFANGTANTGYDWATTASGGSPYTLSAYSGYSAMSDGTGGVTDTSNSRITASQTQAGNLTTNSLKIENPAASQSLALGGNLLTLTGGGLLVTGTNAVSINGTAGATRLTAGNGSGSYDLVVHQFNSGGLTIGAVIGDNGGANATSLTKSGTGPLTLSGSNTFTGGLFVNSGTVTLANAGALNSTVGSENAVTINGSGTLSLNGNSVVVKSLGGSDINGAIVQNGHASTAATLTVGNSANASSTFAGVIQNGGVGVFALTKAGAGTLILSGSNTYTGTTTISAGTLRLEGAAPLNTGRTYTINGGAVMNLNGGATFNTSVAGSSTINGIGTLRFSGGDYGRAYVNGGGTLTLALGAGGLIDIQAGSRVLTWYSSVVNFTGNQATLNVDGTITGNNSLIINAAALTGAGTISNSSTTLNIGVNNGSGTFSGAIQSGTTLNMSGTGTQTLSGNNTYTGVTTVTGGTLQFAKANSLLAANWTKTKVTVNSGGTIAFNVGGTDEFTTGNVTTLLTGLGGTVANNGLRAGSTIAFDTTNASGGTFTVADVIANTSGTGGGAVGLKKLGNNTLVLTNSNTYSGPTTVSAGTLLINGNSSTATGAVAVNGGTLGGTGRTGGAVTVAPLATLSPGASIESLDVASLSMASTSVFAYEVLNNSSAGADLLASRGALSLTDVTLSLDAASLLALGGAGWAMDNKLTLISYLGADVTSGFTGYVDDTNYTFGLNTWRFNYNDMLAGANYGTDAVAGGQNRFVTMTFIPEPGAALIGSLGLLALLRRRRS